MADAKQAQGLNCMSCGAPIKSGFFCARCQSGEEPEPKKKSEGWKGSAFSGEAKKKKQQAIMKDELRAWGKRLLLLAIVAGIAFAGYSFRDPIVAWVDHVRGVAAPRAKYDPTKDAAANVDDQGQANGQRAFSSKTDK